ncbi:MAG: sigma-70 family RNA polymerase sigma factor [Myxococcota bacterium]|nr:sigma-70 family RNA polymerase sigma factor [Myxococcota bacterium]
MNEDDQPKQPEHNTASIEIEPIVVAAIAGDAEARQALLQRYRYFIRRAVLDFRNTPGARQRDETGDLEQEIAITVLENISEYQWHGRKAFHAWLRKLAKGELIDRYRYHHAAKRDVNRDTGHTALDAKVAGGPGAETRADQQERMEQLQRLLDRLPTTQAQAVMLFHIGHSHQEIGEILDCSAEAARKLVARGRARLVALRQKSI